MSEVKHVTKPTTYTEYPEDYPKPPYYPEYPDYPKPPYYPEPPDYPKPPYYPEPPDYPKPPYYGTVARGHFETPLGPRSPFLAGDIYATVHERGGVEPNTIIRTDTDWFVDIRWRLTGSLVPLICGKWCVHLFLESMGPGPELALPDPGPEVHIPLDPCGDGKYRYYFEVRKGVVKAEHCSTPYKLVVGITYLNACDQPGCIAGFVDGPMLQFYEAHKNGYKVPPHKE